MAQVGSTADTLEAVRDLLQAGMTTGQETESWYIKTWKLRSPLSFDSRELPLGIVQSQGPSRRDQYVQEDTQVIPMTIYFFSSPVTRATSVDGANEAVEAMIDRATDLIRVDPSLGGRFYDLQVTGSVPRQPGYFGNATYPGAELQCQALRRKPWRID